MTERTKSFQQLADEQLGKDACYDWAMPQEWFNEAIELTGINPSGHVVWLYSKEHKIFGQPYGLTDTGKQIIEDMSK